MKFINYLLLGLQAWFVFLLGAGIMEALRRNDLSGFVIFSIGFIIFLAYFIFELKETP